MCAPVRWGCRHGWVTSQSLYFQLCMLLGETKGNPGAALGAMKWFSVTCPEDLSSALCCKGRWK